MADVSEKRYEAAEAGLTAILDGPAALEATIGLALVNEMQGDAPAAAEWYEKALVLDPGQRARLGSASSRVTLPAASAGGAVR